MTKFTYEKKDLKYYLTNNISSVVALIGTFVTLCLGLITWISNQTTIKISQQKERPLASVWYRDNSDSAIIFLENKGKGPLIITNYFLEDLYNGKKHVGIYDCFLEYKKEIDYHTGNQNNTVISPNDRVKIFYLNKNTSPDSAVKSLNKTLSRYKIVVEYKDVYDNNMPIYQRSLEWFGRLFINHK